MDSGLRRNDGMDQWTLCLATHYNARMFDHHASENDTTAKWLDADTINAVLAKGEVGDAARVRGVLDKALELNGLDFDDVAVLSRVEDPDLTEEIFAAARKVKDEIYGKRVVFFAPLYVSNLCGNECTYCAFRKNNHGLIRHSLSREEIEQETKILIDQGHKRLLLVAGENVPGGLKYLLDAIETIYSVTSENGEIRRINVNIAPQSTDDFRRIKDKEIGTYQCFQETYDRDVYKQVHLRGKKADFDWRASSFDRAMLAGIDDIGMGVLFGLADWRFELLALMTHIHHLETRFGVGCHTISFPRIEPANGSEFSYDPPNRVSDDDFKKIVAIMRLAVPYTGLIMSTRETAEIRKETLALGISQISAGSRTNPGGYGDEEDEAAQFQLGDHRALDEVVKDLSEMDLMPSFCTACYRLGRTGVDFMDLAKPGLIRAKCGPNAVATFFEYLTDYAETETFEAGMRAIENEIAAMDPPEQKISRQMIERIRAGKRDVFC